jgi:hypothetical protein
VTFAQIEVNALVFPTSVQHFVEAFGKPDSILHDMEYGCMRLPEDSIELYRYRKDQYFAVHSDSGHREVKVNVLNMEKVHGYKVRIHGIAVEPLMTDRQVIDRFRDLILGNSKDEIYLNLEDDPGIMTLKLLFKRHRLCSIYNECPF